MSVAKRLSAVVVAVCATVSPLRAANGVLIVERTTIGDAVRTSQIRIEPERMRADILGAGGGSQVVIFDGTKQMMWVVNEARKTYTEMTRADVERMGSQMGDMMARMQEQLKNLPPEQRAQVEAMMKGRGGMAMPGAGAAERIEYRRTGTDRVGAWTCVTYDGFRGTEKIAELCAVEPQDLGFTEADFAVSRQLAEFFRSLLPQNADAVFRIGTPGDQGFSGVPVRRASLAGQQRIVTEVVEMSRQAFSNDLFTVPAGFERQSMPFGPAAR
jgi:hypothetical protein